MLRSRRNGLVGERRTRQLFIGLYASMALLSVRNVFRFAE